MGEARKPTSAQAAKSMCKKQGETKLLVLLNESISDRVIALYKAASSLSKTKQVNKLVSNSYYSTISYNKLLASLTVQ